LLSKISYPLEYKKTKGIYKAASYEFEYRTPHDISILSRQVYIPILRYMFYGHTRRYELEWEGRENCSHMDTRCRCTLIGTLLIDGEKDVCKIPRVLNGEVLTAKKQMIELMKYTVSKYVVYDGKVIPLTNPLDKGRALLKFGFEFYSTPTNRLIRPPFHATNMPRPKPVEVMPNLRRVIRQIDKRYFANMGLSHLLSGEHLKDASTKVRSLKASCLRMFSFEALFYSLFGGNKAVVNTMENLEPEKIVKLFSEFSNNTQSREGFTELRPLMARAVRRIENLLNCRKDYKSIDFIYDGAELLSFVTRGTSSAGIRPGVEYTVNGPDYRERYITGGKKSDQFVEYAVHFDEFIHRLVQNSCELKSFDKLEDFEIYCVMRMKDEFKYSYPPTAEECALLKMKCREFFIPNLSQQFLSKLLMSPRQILERGDVIRIGQKWNHGEAQRFSEYMHGSYPNMRWHTGDIAKIDKNIRDWLLTMYVKTGSFYFSHPDELSHKLHHALTILLSERINVKTVLHVGGQWTLIKGMMYSGGYETSHGDSWILLFAFCLYLEYTMAVNTERAYLIDKALLRGLIRIVVYGDDHVFCTPDELADILNEQTFGIFLKRFIGLEIRDAVSIPYFHTSISDSDMIIRPGVVFLKIYFIIKEFVEDEDFPVIYPFKPTHDTMIKLFCNKANLEITYPLQAIGQAYDTRGTNVTAYNLVKHFYDYYIRILDKSPRELFNMAMEASDNVALRNLVGRTGITLEEMAKGFPSRHMLLALHKKDKELGSNVIRTTDRKVLYALDDYDF